MSLGAEVSRAALLAAGLLLAVTSAATAAERDGGVAVERPWARPTVGRRQTVGAAYATLRNLGAAPERLLGARAGAAQAVALHATSVDADGVARMRPAGPVEIPPGGAVELAPGGLHLMLVGLAAPLVEGGSLPVTLVFERAGEVAVDFAVGGGGGQGAGHGHGGGHGGGH